MSILSIEGAVQHLKQFENRVLHPDRPYSPDYWLHLPERFPDLPDLVVDWVKKGKMCTLWSYAAYDALTRDGYGKQFSYLGVQNNRTNNLWDKWGIWGHLCLKSRKEGGIYVVDGNAGQFFPNGEYKQGYYGLLRNAPEVLQELYSH